MEKKFDNVLAQEIFQVSKSHCDYAEIFFENTYTTGISLSNKEIETINNGRNFGVGIRLLNKTDQVYGYTSDLSKENLIKLTKSLASGLKNGDCQIADLKETNVEKINEVKIKPNTVSKKEKLELLNKFIDKALSKSELVKKVMTNYSDNTREITIINSEGVVKHTTKVMSSLYMSFIATKGDKTETYGERWGTSKGFEYYQDKSLLNSIDEGIKCAELLLDAEYAPSKEMDVVMENGFGGVIFHEACGHGLEATSVAKNLSIFSNRVGEKVAHESVTAIDDGTIKNEWGSINTDDEGGTPQKNVLIENGILKGYMIDKLGARRMNTSPTGSSRRESYKYAPTSRMTNTFIANGKSSLEDMVKDIKFGLYAVKMGGGSVDPISGDFNFSVRLGYLIEDGKITKPVKGASLIGNGPAILQKIDMVGDNLELGYGMCGSVSGSIPACVGQPRIRVRNITVGGR